jgi:hypothetical protein
MKKSKLIISVAVLIVLSLIGAIAYGFGSKELKDLGKDDSVSVKVMGSGRYNQVSLELSSKKDLSFTIPCGVVLENKNSSSQNMVVGKTYEISLNANETKIIPVVAYCVDYYKHTPEKADNFGVTDYEKTQNKELAKLLKYTDENNIAKDDKEMEVVQQAVWLISNGVDYKKRTQYTLDYSLVYLLVSDWVKDKSKDLESIALKKELENIRAAYLAGKSLESLADMISQNTDTSTLHNKIVAFYGSNKYESLYKNWLESMDAESDDSKDQVNDLLKNAGISKEF